MEHHRETSAGSRKGAPSEQTIDERAREYERFEAEQRRRFESYAEHLTERERRERFPLG